MDCTLTTAYFGNIQYFSKFIEFKSINIEIFDNFQKQTFRNRCEIYSANGKLSLTVPVIKNHNQKTLTKDILIDYTENWQKNHFKAIESAYRSTPYYQYFIDDFIDFYETKYKYLLDLNNRITETVLKVLNIEKSFSHTKEYNEFYENDFRQTISPKYKSTLFNNKLNYYQVFENKHGFIQNLSIIDLIFNEGTDSKQFLAEFIL
ncbi:MAG: hypothetical protein A2033_07420 [Bacteroidetes bacterium GWA2_31_9]|nr:MAG: hypothetical protein A2033_07420 [Bacteroidetes bacterium GWA2_31_9]